MKMCRKCHHLRPEADFRWKQVRSVEYSDGHKVPDEPHLVALGATCRRCRSAQQRFLRGHPTVKDCVDEILDILGT